MARVCTLGIKPACKKSCEFARACSAAEKAGDEQFNVDTEVAGQLRAVTETTGLAKSGYRVRTLIDPQVGA
jgi:hypothetical protein